MTSAVRSRFNNTRGGSTYPSTTYFNCKFSTGATTTTATPTTKAKTKVRHSVGGRMATVIQQQQSAVSLLDRLSVLRTATVTAASHGYYPEWHARARRAIRKTSFPNRTLRADSRGSRKSYEFCDHDRATCEGVGQGESGADSDSKWKPDRPRTSPDLNGGLEETDGPGKDGSFMDNAGESNDDDLCGPDDTEHGWGDGSDADIEEDEDEDEDEEEDEYALDEDDDDTSMTSSVRPRYAGNTGFSERFIPTFKQKTMSQYSHSSTPTAGLVPTCFDDIDDEMLSLWSEEEDGEMSEEEDDERTNWSEEETYSSGSSSDDEDTYRGNYRCVMWMKGLYNAIFTPHAHTSGRKRRDDYDDEKHQGRGDSDQSILAGVPGNRQFLKPKSVYRKARDSRSDISTPPVDTPMCTERYNTSAIETDISKPQIKRLRRLSTSSSMEVMRGVESVSSIGSMSPRPPPPVVWPMISSYGSECEATGLITVPPTRPFSPSPLVSWVTLDMISMGQDRTKNIQEAIGSVEILNLM